MAQIFHTPQAGADLVDILDYLGRHSPAAADRFAEAVEQRCHVLAQFPQMGRSRDELAVGLRSFPVGKYVLFYRPVTDGIEVIRVLHGSRDIPSAFS